MDFQTRLYRLRKEQGLSQEELAHTVGVSRQAVQKWEAGTSRPDLDNLIALAQCLRVSMDYLILGQNTQNPPPAPASTVQPVCPHSWCYEYRSQTTLFGVPLVHINVSRWGLRWARGIIAVGNLATGVISLGGLSAGLLSVGGIGLGGLVLGGLGLGLAAFGGLAIGALFALGGLACSLGLAVGGCAVGGSWAIGGVALAQQVAAGGAAAAPIAIGEAVEGMVTFPKVSWGPDTGPAIEEAIRALFPNTPRFLVELFSRLC